jgi:hypothetical protein
LVNIRPIINATGTYTISDYPLSNEAIEPAAEALIREHGTQALSEAARQVSALNSKGFYALAATWQQIRHKIVEQQQLEERHMASK